MMAFTAVAIVLFWLMDAAIDYLIHYDEPFMSVLFPSGKELSFRLLFSAWMIVFGSSIAWAIRLKAKADDKLRTSQERYRELVEFTSAVHWEVDAATMKFTYMSPQVEKLLGYPASSWTDFDFWVSCLHPEDTQWATEYCITMTNDLEDHEFLYRAISADGEVVWIKDLVNVFSEGGSPVKLRGMFMDVTELKKAEQKLKSSICEKEVLLGEVHHRVKNNMSVVTSLLNLQLRQLEDESLRNVFQKSCNRIMALAQVHEAMYANEDLADIDVQAYLRHLTFGLGKLYGAPLKGVSLDVSSGVQSLLPDKLIPCGLIVNELVTNSLVHAFDGTDGGSVKVSLSTSGDTYRLEVSDDGRGLPEGLEPGRDAKGTIGHNLISSLVRQLGGELVVAIQGGTSVTVTFC